VSHDSDGGIFEEQLDREAIRGRAISGAGLIAVRSVLVLFAALGANAVLAHELSPRQIGLVAFGVAIMTFAATLSDGGLASGLIRTAVPVDRPLLQAVLGLQLVATTSLFVLIAAVTLPFGLVGQLTSVMALSLPIDALYTPAAIMLERSLQYRTVARLEVVQALSYYASAVALVVAGFGIWSLAIAAVIRSCASVVLFFRARPDLFFLPSFRLEQVRPLLRFGINFQATSLINVLRDQGLNVGIAVIAGTATLGVWTLTRRVLEVPMLMFQTLWRVSFPAMSQLMTLERNVRPLLERAVVLTSIGAGALLAPLAAAAPGLVPTVFGARWSEVGPLTAVSCAALLVSGPISVATAGYLYAAGDARVVLRATVWHTLAWIAAALALLPLLGPMAVPIGLLLGSTVDVLLLARPTHRRTGAKLYGAVSRPTAAAAVAGSFGMLVTMVGGDTLVSGLAAAVAALTLYALLIFVLQRDRSVQLLVVARSALQGVGALRSRPV